MKPHEKIQSILQNTLGRADGCYCPGRYDDILNVRSHVELATEINLPLYNITLDQIHTTLRSDNVGQ